MIPLCIQVVGLVSLTLTVSVLANGSSDKHISPRTNGSSPFDPFEQLRIRATPRPSEPICCLVPLSSDPLPTTAEFLSFEEWKSKQLELQVQAQSANQTPSPDTPPAEAPPGSSLVTSAVTLGETDSSLAAPTESAPSLSPHFRVPLTDRFNYASLDCSARVHTSHRSARSPSAILSSKKDRYMLSPCSADPNFVVVELCDDIRIDTVQLANFEFFSGVFRDFKVSVAQTYTTDGKGWVEAGTYRAKNIRGVQSFHPLVELRPFYRYLRIDFLSHYGGEFYCPISLLRVYGLTQLEEWKWEVWQGGSEISGPDASADYEESAKVANETVLESAISGNATALSVTEEVSTMVATEPTPIPGSIVYPFTLEKPMDRPQSTQASTMPSTSVAPESTASIEVSVTLGSVAFTPLSMVPSTTPYVLSPNNTIPEASAKPNTTFENATSVAIPNASQPMDSPITSSIKTLIPIPSTSSVPPGESIYRTIMNRLAMLETNTTLYQKYVEEQTLQVREALRRLEEDVGRLEGISKAQQHTFSKTVHELERRRLQMEEERWELLSKVNHLADEVVLEKRLSIAQLCLLLTVLVFMTLTRGSRTDAVSFLDGTMHRLNRFGRHSPWSSVDWHQKRSRSPTPTPGHTSESQKSKKYVRSATVSLPHEEDVPLSVSVPTTPLARSQTPRSHLRRPTTPRHYDVFRLGSSERPLARLRRSNSHTTPANTLLSAKRFARSSHLHEVHSIRRHAMSGSDEELPGERDGEIDGSPRPRKHTLRTQVLSDLGPISRDTTRWTPEHDGSEGESWVDTEPGSELGVEQIEGESQEVHQEIEVRQEHSTLQSPILSRPPSGLRRHFGTHNPPSPASVTD